jgi:hypothetical protein
MPSVPSRYDFCDFHVGHPTSRVILELLIFTYRFPGVSRLPLALGVRCFRPRLEGDLDDGSSGLSGVAKDGAVGRGGRGGGRGTGAGGRVWAGLRRRVNVPLDRLYTTLQLLGTRLQRRPVFFTSKRRGGVSGRRGCGRQTLGPLHNALLSPTIPQPRPFSGTSPPLTSTQNKKRTV